MMRSSRVLACRSSCRADRRAASPTPENVFPVSFSKARPALILTSLDSDPATVVLEASATVSGPLLGLFASSAIQVALRSLHTGCLFEIPWSGFFFLCSRSASAATCSLRFEGTASSKVSLSVVQPNANLRLLPVPSPLPSRGLPSWENGASDPWPCPRPPRCFYSCFLWR